MATEATPTAPPGPPLAPAGDPYFYGWRMVPRWAADGTQQWEKVPLTAWDVLHPEEDDFIVQSDAHDDDCLYLKQALEEVTASRPGVAVFSDLRIDWQLPALSAHGPDVVVFEGLKGPWARERGTFPVRDMGARPLLAIEVVSPNTRDLDTVVKVIEYHRAGVPVYVLVTRDERGPAPVVGVIGYRAEAGGYARTPDDPHGVWVESVGVWVCGFGDRVACFDRHRVRIPEREELTRERNTLRGRVDAEQARADAEQARADAEAAGRAAATTRADAAELKLKELEEELKRLRGDTN